MQTAKVASLLTTSTEYREQQEVQGTLRDLKDVVAFVRNRRKYIVPRPCEDARLYEIRLLKFTYTPILNNCLRELVNKIVLEPVAIEEEQHPLWDRFYEDIDGQGRAETAFYFNLCYDVLYHGSIYVAVDRVTTGIPRTQLELESLPLPYLKVFLPEQVLNRGKDWFVTQALYEDCLPLESPVTMARWQLWQPGVNWLYEAPVMVDEYGAINQVQVQGKWLPVDHKKAILEGKAIEHGLPEPNLFRLALEPAEWLGAACYTKQLQYTQLESSWTEAGSVAGTIQRIFTPLAANPDSDERLTYTEPDYSQLVSDNNHILIGSDFRFSESSGAAISSIQAQLAYIEQQINTLLSRAYKSVAIGADGVNTVEQSGESKKVDMLSLDDTVSTFTLKVAPFYVKLLTCAAKFMGLKPPKLTIGQDDLDNAPITLEEAYDLTPEEVEEVMNGGEGDG